jgi:MFS family permease
MIALFALATAGLSLLTASVGVLMLMFAIQGFFASVQTPTGYSKMITARFDDRRGLALGIALAGQGVGTIFVPQYARLLMQHYGWRIGYVGLGVAILVLAFLPVAVLFAEPEEMKRERAMAKTEGAADHSALPGITLSEALRNPRYWLLTISIFLSLTVTNGVLMHTVSMLTDRGISMNLAVAAMSISGIAMTIGRLISGYLLDKIFAVYIAIFFQVLPMIGLGILISGAAGSWPLAAVVFMGLLVGVEFDLMAFILSRYFGIRSFGVLYGFMLMFVELANAAGTLLMGWCFELMHSYVPMLYAFEVFMALAILLISRMGPYRFPAPDRRRAIQQVAASR